jgi:cold shock CspA family protein
MANNEKMTGTVIRLFPNRGFAFIRGADGFTRFMHASQVYPREDFDTMREGVGVRFKSQDHPTVDNQRGNGMRAVDVEVIK